MRPISALSDLQDELDAAQCWAHLLAAIVVKAIEDAEHGEPTCNGACSKEGHCCQQDARLFLESPGCWQLAESLGLEDAGRVLTSLVVEDGRL